MHSPLHPWVLIPTQPSIHPSTHTSLNETYAVMDTLRGCRAVKFDSCNNCYIIRSYYTCKHAAFCQFVIKRRLLLLLVLSLFNQPLSHSILHSFVHLSNQTSIHS